MDFTAKLFDELTTTELYELLRARFEVFVIEQQCIYPDLDGVDYNSLHIFRKGGDRIVAYLRAFETEKGVVRMGRVLTTKRGIGLGAKLLKYAIEEIDRRFMPKQIIIESQTHAVGFYAREGFKVCSDEFMDAGIPHVKMTLER
ncbi:MAG: GNAT family N-acetyltransferase [Ruminococcus sp.]|nr:GNAT family N-acetyltransferase [Ruminococcus sp.]